MVGLQSVSLALYRSQTQQQTITAAEIWQVQGNCWARSPENLQSLSLKFSTLLFAELLW